MSDIRKISSFITRGYCGNEIVISLPKDSRIVFCKKMRDPTHCVIRFFTEETLTKVKSQFLLKFIDCDEEVDVEDLNFIGVEYVNDTLYRFYYKELT